MITRVVSTSTRKKKDLTKDGHLESLTLRFQFFMLVELFNETK